MKVVYDEKTQGMIDQSKKLIEERAAMLVSRFNDKFKSSINPSPRELIDAEKEIREDTVLVMLHKAICDVMATASPSYQIVINKQ